MKAFKIHKPETETFNSQHSIMADVLLTEWLFSGIHMIYLDGPVTEEAQLDWDSGEGDITMCFNLSGRSRFRAKAQSVQFDFSANQHNTFYEPGGKGTVIVEGPALKLFIIKLSKTSFFEMCGTENAVLKSFHERIVLKDPLSLFAHNPEIGFLLQTCIASVLSCHYEKSLKKIFLFSKIAEMVVLQLESFKEGGDVKNTWIKTDYDKERIWYAKEYLLKNIASPPTLKQLARVSGINEFKLKKGFKELFHQTVYEYLSDVRLEIGKNDLLEKRKSISQVAFELGYSSLQHFSNSFKRKFGVSPSQLR